MGCVILNLQCAQGHRTHCARMPGSNEARSHTPLCHASCRSPASWIPGPERPQGIVWSLFPTQGGPITSLWLPGLGIMVSHSPPVSISAPFTLYIYMSPGSHSLELSRPISKLALTVQGCPETMDLTTPLLINNFSTMAWSPHFCDFWL